MITIHFSAKFKDRDFSFHGEKHFPASCEAEINPNIESVVKAMKSKLKEKCKVWNIDPTSVISFDVYHYNDNGEQVVWEWGE